jgi:hypothetical protein
MLFFGGAGLGGVEATFAARLEIGTDLVGARQSQNQHIFLDWTSRREPLERNLKNKTLDRVLESVLLWTSRHLRPGTRGVLKVWGW